MEIVKQSAVLVNMTENPVATIAKIARTCYKSNGTNDLGLINRLLTSRHHAMLEFAEATFRFITDRGVANEMVRHRMCSFAQESTRYCAYPTGLHVICPPQLDNDHEGKEYWVRAILECEKSYMAMLNANVQPQIARSVLPLCLKTEIVVKANFREWLHIFELRLAKDAHPQIQELMGIAFNILHDRCPEVFR